MRRLIRYILPTTILIIFIIWTILVKTVDVHYINGIGFLGFYNFNTQVNNHIIEFARTNEFSKITDVLMYLSFIVALVFVAIGVIELIKRKSLRKVDPIIYLVGAAYIAIAIEYFIFELAKVNFSPLSTPEELKASYPSSHVLIFNSVMGVGVITLFHYFKVNKILKLVTYISLVILLLSYPVARLYSGHHYFSDIIGGVLLSAFIITLFNSIRVDLLNKKEENIKE